MPQTQVAVVTFDGFNEIDSFVASAMINRCRQHGLVAYITTPTPKVSSMNGVQIEGQRPLEFAAEADVVLIGSGIKTRDVIADDHLINGITLDPERQLIGSQCSGALVLARLGLLDTMPACTDRTSRPFVEERGVKVRCLASQYLAAWTIARTLGADAARAVVDYVAPYGENAATVERVMSVIGH